MGMVITVVRSLRLTTTTASGTRVMTKYCVGIWTISTGSPGSGTELPIC
jgi:hypothetical protein